MTENGGLSVKVDLNATDFRRVLMWYQRKRQVWIIVISTILLLLVGAAFSGKMDGPKILGIRLEFILAAVIAPIVFLGLSFFGVWRQARKLESISEPTELIFSVNGIKSISHSSETSTSWSRYDKIVELKRDFVVFPQENVFYSVPKRFFREQNKIDDLKTLIREHLGNRAKLKV